MNKKRFEHTGDLAHSMGVIDMNKDDVRKWLAQHILEKKGIGRLSYNKTHLADYNRASFYTIPPFIFTIGHFPDESMSEFSLLVDCGSSEHTMRYVQKILQGHFSKRGDKVSYESGKNEGVAFNAIGSARSHITRTGSDLHNALCMHTTHVEKYHIIMNFNMRQLRKDQYFGVLTDFLYEYVCFTKEYANEIKAHHFRMMTTGTSADLGYLFEGQEN